MCNTLLWITFIIKVKPTVQGSYPGSSAVLFIFSLPFPYLFLLELRWRHQFVLFLYIINLVIAADIFVIMILCTDHVWCHMNIIVTDITVIGLFVQQYSSLTTMAITSPQEGNLPWLVDSPCKGPVMQKVFLCHLSGTNFGEILITIQNFSFMKMHLKISSAKWPPFCPGEMS